MFKERMTMSIMLPDSSKLNIAGLSGIFESKSNSYKLFWFSAIMTKVKEGRKEFSFEELVDEMIADAWYMVSEYHLNLGPKDYIEEAVKCVKAATGMKSSEKKDNVLKYLRDSNDENLAFCKKTLIQNVPYRLQSTMMPGFQSWQRGTRAQAEEVNARERLMYYFPVIDGLNSRVRITDEWFDYLTVNQAIVDGWIQFNMIIYLQRRNPSVPGISDKLKAPEERKLTKVINYWKTISEIRPIYDIYGNELIGRDNISIDHFVPWSYVAHDELWNLHPTTRSINSSKSNNLPEWDMYIDRLCDMEYESYRMIWQYDKVHDAFDKCAREHINSDEIRGRLYGQGHTREEFSRELKSIIQPVYESARNCGFGIWCISVRE